MTEQKIIYPDSPEAATPVQITAWKDIKGMIWQHEETARYNSANRWHCTRCKTADAPWSGSLCHGCQSMHDRDRWEKLPLVEWDGKTPLAVFDGDEFFFDEESAEEYVFEHPDAMLVVCEPQRLHTVDVDTWCDEMAEDDDLPDEVQTALDALNAAIDKTGPVSYWPGKERVVLKVG